MSDEASTTPQAVPVHGGEADTTKRWFKPSAKQWTSMILLSAVICSAAILVGTYTIPLGKAAIVLQPVLWAVLMGAVIGVQRWKPLSGENRAVNSVLLNVSIVLFLAALGVGVGPSLGKLSTIGPAIVLQEVGHIFGTVILALPVAVALGLGKAAIGATWAIDRESYLAYALQKFGVKSPIYRGVFSVWLLGSVFGAVFISLLAGILGGLGIFDVRSLALGLGLGSGSMMIGGAAALTAIHPDQGAEILALAGLSNLVTNLVGFYAGVFVSMPISQRLYKFWSRLFRRNDDGHRLDSNGNAIVPATKRKEDNSDGLDVNAVIKDPEVAMGSKLWIMVFVASLAVGLLLNVLGTHKFAPTQITGILLLGVLTAIAFVLSKLMPNVPPSVWVLALATLVTAPFFPGSSVLVSITKDFNPLYVGLGSIAMLGLNIGRDVNALKTLNWRLIIIACITFTASFVAAAGLAQFVIHL
ncbi:MULTISPECIES: DUF3100 domain-containing protein [Arthrobacter]|uniref:DUF3100 domain-containing protein n=2 Tax=Arthrobacter TaxID=1663 RepID=A0ABU9KRR7_9MICC|nr:DUF3100 domain-containing protein [Arthrobacter sp. YJM1]MDP5228022.1 DUF3100 domain-containing protein [Arthrobacter sp. YJM1]